MVMPAGTVNVSVCEFGGIGIADGGYMAREKQVNAGHGVVEIEFYVFEAYCGNHALQSVSFLILQRKYIADFKESVGYFSFVFKDVFGYFNQRILVVFAIRLGGGNPESKLIAFAQAIQVLFKCRNHHTNSENKRKRLAAIGRFHQLAFRRAFIQCVVYGHYLVLCNCH